MTSPHPTPPAGREPVHVVVVLTYEGREDTLRLLPTLHDDASPPTVVVVDNASTDGTVAAVTAAWPQVALVANRSNLGFSGGMNTGLRWALSRGADVVTILNNDTLVSASTMRHLARVALTGRAVSPVVHYLGHPDDIWFGEGAIRADTGLPHHVQSDAFAPADPATGWRPTPILAGACVSASAQTWRRVGLLDDRYFLTFEDSEWSVRARRLGVDLVVDTTVTIDHQVSASFVGSTSYLGSFYYCRNGLLFTRRVAHTSPAQSARFLRRHVLPSVVGPLRAGQPTEALRRAVVCGWAVAAYVTGRFGVAPRPLRALAARWARAS